MSSHKHCFPLFINVGKAFVPLRLLSHPLSEDPKLFWMSGPLGCIGALMKTNPTQRPLCYCHTVLPNSCYYYAGKLSVQYSSPNDTILRSVISHLWCFNGALMALRNKSLIDLAKVNIVVPSFLQICQLGIVNMQFDSNSFGKLLLRRNSMART